MSRWVEPAERISAADAVSITCRAAAFRDCILDDEDLAQIHRMRSLLEDELLRIVSARTRRC
jgi:hypothetical protein